MISNALSVRVSRT